MGINIEYVKLLANLKRSKKFKENPIIIELGAQEVCPSLLDIEELLTDYGIKISGINKDAKSLYLALGFRDYTAIDANATYNSLPLDLNKNLYEEFGFKDTFDLVTNLGTSEHCFDQYQVFRNIHELCNEGGLMIHGIPTQGWVNHAFYAYHPRTFADIALANDYEIVEDYCSKNLNGELHTYSLDTYKRFDDGDLLYYIVLRKQNDNKFKMPFDSMFLKESALKPEFNTSNDKVNFILERYSPYMIHMKPNHKEYASLLLNAPAKLLISELIKRVTKKVLPKEYSL